jgi:hypothetical protein
LIVYYCHFPSNSENKGRCARRPLQLDVSLISDIQFSANHIDLFDPRPHSRLRSPFLVFVPTWSGGLHGRPYGNGSALVPARGEGGKLTRNVSLRTSVDALVGRRHLVAFPSLEASMLLHSKRWCGYGSALTHDGGLGGGGSCDQWSYVASFRTSRVLCPCYSSMSDEGAYERVRVPPGPTWKRDDDAHLFHDCQPRVNGRQPNAKREGKGDHELMEEAVGRWVAGRSGRR